MLNPRLKRVALTCVMVIATLNIWTGSPLLALWVGSRVQGSGRPSMLAVGVVAVTLGALTIALVKLLARIDAVYARVAGRPSSVSRHVPWLRSMRGERPHEKKHARELSPLEVILISTVVLAVALFEIWFLLLLTLTDRPAHRAQPQGTADRRHCDRSPEAAARDPAFRRRPCSAYARESARSCDGSRTNS